MPKVYAISDTWFNRLLDDDPNANVIDNNDHMIDCWNDIVNKDDVVYVLGGFGIGDLYHILVRLNGQIHFLDNYFNDDERQFIQAMKECVNKSSDIGIKERIVFEPCQIKVLNDLDAVLSYFPLEDWSGKSTGTYCFHGLTDKISIDGHNISCTSKGWDYMPLNLSDFQDGMKAIIEKL